MVLKNSNSSARSMSTIIKNFRKKIVFSCFLFLSAMLQPGLCQAAGETFIAENKMELYTILSEQLMQRSSSFYIDYTGKMGSALKKITKQLNSTKTKTYWRGMYTLLQDMAEAVDDPNTTSDSDYLVGIIDAADIYYANGMFCFDTVTYYETKAQTRKVDKKIQSVLKKKRLYEEENPIIVIEKVHNYLIQRITYDTRKASKCNYSAYHGLMDQQTVCNGYALAAYKMLNELGIPCKYITGMATNFSGKKQLHAWNIVKIEDKWYHLDITWDDNDDGRIYYDYFMRGADFFYQEHKPDYWYRTKRFTQKYNVVKKDL